MKKGQNKTLIILIAILAVLVLLFLFSFFSGKKILGAPGDSVYSFLNDVKINPYGYTIVIGTNTDAVEVASAAEFAGEFGVTKSKLDTEQDLQENLIIIGNSNVNVLTNQLVGSLSLASGQALVQVFAVNSGYSIVIAGVNSSATQNAINLLKNYDSYQSQLNYIGVKITGTTITPLTCADGTIYNACSANKPKYCDAGVLVDKCSVCGCDSGTCTNEICQVAGGIEVTRDLPELSIGTTGLVSLSVDLKGQTAKSLVLTETMPVGITYVEGSGNELGCSATTNTCSWIFSTKTSNFAITYEVIPESAGEKVFSGTWAGNVSGILLDGTNGGESSVIIEGGCTDECDPNLETFCVGNDSYACVLGSEGCYVRAYAMTCEFGCDLGVCLEATCEDSDNGINLDVQGTTTYAGQTYTDSCGSGVVRKYYCGTNGIEYTDVVCADCSNGICNQQFICQDGNITQYTCQDGSKVDWCTCVNHTWDCINAPENQCPSPVTVKSLVGDIILNNNLQGYKIVIGRAAQPSDSIAALDIAGRLKITTTLIDDELIGEDNYLVVGGSCVNSKAAELLGLEYPTCGFNAVGVIPENRAIIRAVLGAKNHLVVAGWESIDTRRAARVLVGYNNNANSLDKQEVIISGTGTIEDYVID